MTGTSPNWTARLAWAALLFVAGAGLTIWTLSRWQDGARFFGVAPQPTQQLQVAPARPAALVPPTAPVADPATAAHIAVLEQRLATVEHATQRAEGSAGRADAMLVAFAARRAIDRGVALGYLEPLLVDRFSTGHEAAVATLITGARQPTTLASLTASYEKLGPQLRSTDPDQSLFDRIGQEFGSLIEIRRASAPSARPQARFDNALAQLRIGEVDVALAETLRLPAAPRAAAWVAGARRYSATHRALDELESAALFGNNAPPPVAG